MGKHPPVIMASERSPLLHPENEHAARHNGTPKRVTLDSRETRGGRPVPLTIGHRGFKGAAPENTMAAFKAAAQAGVDAIETDLHLTRDGVVVLCHDETLERCYGNKAKVRDLDWSEISKLRTLREPHQVMPRLIDLLEFLAESEQENIWLLLDIKTHDNAEEIMKRTAEAFASVSTKQPWSTRVTPCCWSAEYIKLSMKYLPDYPITHVGFSVTYARCLIDIPNISFSMFTYSLVSPAGRSFLRDMKQLGIPVHVWTVNEESWMRWCIRKEVSGVITDEVTLFHDVCNSMGSGEGQTQSPGKSLGGTKAVNNGLLYRTVRFLGEMILFQVLSTIFMARERLKHGSPSYRINKALNG